MTAEASALVSRETTGMRAGGRPGYLSGSHDMRAVIDPEPGVPRRIE